MSQPDLLLHLGHSVLAVFWERKLFLTMTLALTCVYWWQQGQLLLGLAVPRKAWCTQLIGDWEKSTWTSALNFFCLCGVFIPCKTRLLNYHPGLAIWVWSHMQHWDPITMTSDGASESISYRSCALISAMLYYMVSKWKILWWWNNASSFPIFCYSQVPN